LHDEEEILLLLAGEVDLIIPSLEGFEGTQRKRLRVGEFVYYPAGFMHTLETVSKEPANYLMFKWSGGLSGLDSPLAFGHFHLFFDVAEQPQVETGLHTRVVFEGPTAYLRRLQCHTSTLTAGAGYDPHIDAYEVAIVVLEGEVETLGERVGPHGVIFYPSGEPHGMLNPGGVTARYVVFEFHGAQTSYNRALPRLPPTLRDKLTDPLRWKRKLGQVVRRIRNLFSK
jgi:quercetin dioxygenase-like cupin family protein